MIRESKATNHLSCLQILETVFLPFIYFFSDKNMGGKQSLISDEDLDDYQVGLNGFLKASKYFFFK
jgi:hypothetical protein